MDTKTFNTKLAGIVRSTNTMKDNVQDLINAGLDQYEQHGNTVFLTALVSKLKGTKALPLRTITAYITAQANVKWHSSTKDGVKVERYVKANKEEERKVERLGVTWYDWEGGNHNKVSTIKVENRIASLIKALEEGIKKGTVDDIEKARATVVALKAVA